MVVVTQLHSWFSMLLFNYYNYLHFAQWIRNLNAQRRKIWTLLTHGANGTEVEILEITMKAHCHSAHHTHSVGKNSHYHFHFISILPSKISFCVCSYHLHTLNLFSSSFATSTYLWCLHFEFRNPSITYFIHESPYSNFFFFLFQIYNFHNFSIAIISIVHCIGVCDDDFSFFFFHSILAFFSFVLCVPLFIPISCKILQFA